MQYFFDLSFCEKLWGSLNNIYIIYCIYNWLCTKMASCKIRFSKTGTCQFWAGEELLLIPSDQVFGKHDFHNCMAQFLAQIALKTCLKYSFTNISHFQSSQHVFFKVKIINTDQWNPRRRCINLVRSSRVPF